MAILAQLVDLLPTWGWKLLIPAGLLAPALGFILSLLLYGYRERKLIAVILFYIPTLPLAFLAMSIHTQSPSALCAFVLLLPMGIALGLGVLIPDLVNRQ